MVCTGMILFQYIIEKTTCWQFLACGLVTPKEQQVCLVFLTADEIGGTEEEKKD